MKWFKHDSDAHDSQTLQRFMAMHEREHLAAYGFYWMLLETVAKQMDQSGMCEVEYPKQFWARKFGISVAKFAQFAQSLHTLCALSAEVTQKTIKIKIPNLLKKQDEYTRKLRTNSQQTQEPNKEEEREEEKKERKKEQQYNQDSAREKNQDHSDAVRVIEVFDEAIIEIFGESQRRPWPTANDITFAHGFIAAGAGFPQLQSLFRCRLGKMLSDGKNPPRSLSFFRDAVPEMLAEASRETSRQKQTQKAEPPPPKKPPRAIARPNPNFKEFSLLD